MNKRTIISPEETLEETIKTELKERFLNYSLNRLKAMATWRLYS